MSDEDRAQEVELREWEVNNASRTKGKIRFKAGEQGYGPEFCVSDMCGMDMPPQRREWGFSLCVECQTRVEARRQRLS